MRKEFRLSKYVEWMESEYSDIEYIKKSLELEWPYKCQGKTKEEAKEDVMVLLPEDWCVDVEEESDEDPLGHLFGDVKSIVATITINRK
jgi:hypothetical protein